LEFQVTQAKVVGEQEIEMSTVNFKKIPLFNDLSPTQQELLRPLFYPCDYYADSVIFEQGNPAEFLYIVIVGEVVVNFKPDDGPPINVACVTPGGVVGWSAALGSRRYTSSAVSTAYTQLLRVRGSDLRTLCEQHPNTGIIILDRLAGVIAERLQSTHEIVVKLLEIGLRSPNNHKEEMRS
jgi:CRP-like cAMP-binding protein